MRVDKLANTYPGRLGLQQRVLPAYRVPFFEHLAEVIEGGLSVFAGRPRRGEAILTASGQRLELFTSATNVHLLRGSTYLCYQMGLLDWLRTWDPEALILEANPRYLANWRALDWMRARGRPALGWGLGAPLVSGLGAKVRTDFRRHFLHRFDAIIAYSTMGAAQYRKLGLRPDRVFVAPNAVDPAPPPLLERPAKTGGPFNLLFVGRLQGRKRVDLLLRACAALEEKPMLTIVGDGPEREGLMDLSRKTYPQARFVGAQQGEALDAHFREADLFVLPGTGGLAVQQAMAHGLPVIVAEGDGTQNDLATEENGWLVPPGDLAALTQVLRRALSDPARLRTMGLASHRLTRERFNIENMAAVFVSVLNAISQDG